MTVPGVSGYDPVLRAALIYWATLAVAVISVAGVFLLVRCTFGLDARAVGSAPVAAASTGVRVGRIRRLAYFVAAAGAGVVGALIGLQNLYLESTTVFSIQYSVDTLFMVLVGGMGTIEGRCSARWCCSACRGAVFVRCFTWSSWATWRWPPP